VDLDRSVQPGPGGEMVAKRWKSGKGDTDREFSAGFDRQASATNSVSFLGLFRPEARKSIIFFVSFHRRVVQSWILFLVGRETLIALRVTETRIGLPGQPPRRGA
jgi:hypothetical protein